MGWGLVGPKRAILVAVIKHKLCQSNEALSSGEPKPIIPNVARGPHNVLRSSNVIEVGQIFFWHQPNFANDCNGLSYDG